MFIQLTRIHGDEIYVNIQNILWIESRPDTHLTFLNGTSIIVKEKISEILGKIEEMQLNGENTSAM